tara:strand:+ start:1043 stop:1414 length:372 start_codon:yes stop_codon:yes gene_type:complete
MELDRDYLYHCGGCGKPDKNYPDKEIECDEPDCNDGFVIVSKKAEDGRWVEDGMSECFKCDGKAIYRPRLPNLEYHEWARNDAYGLYTGLYCHKCYDDPTKYTYRKDRYHDEGYAGERMDEDY